MNKKEKLLAAASLATVLASTSKTTSVSSEETGNTWHITARVDYNGPDSNADCFFGSPDSVFMNWRFQKEFPGRTIAGVCCKAYNGSRHVSALAVRNGSGGYIKHDIQSNGVEYPLSVGPTYVGWTGFSYNSSSYGADDIEVTVYFVDGGGCTSCGSTCDSSCKDACQGCNTTCQNGCNTECSGCSGGCQNDCNTGCNGKCNNNCTGSCSGNCTSGCAGGCSTLCSGDCSNDCKSGCTGCSTVCGGTCSNNCTGDCQQQCTGCTNGCKDGCTSCTGCSTVCKHDCADGCKVTCQSSCKGTCQAACTDACSGVAVLLPKSYLAPISFERRWVA